MLLVGTSGDIRYANEAFCSAIGRAPRDVVGANLADLGPDSALWLAIEAAQPWQGQFSLTMGGDRYAGTASVTPLVDASGACAYLLCTSDGLHAQPSVDGAAPPGEQTSSLVFVVDLDGTILFVDRTVPGISREQTVGSSIFEFVPADHHERMRAYLAEVFVGRKSISYEIPSVGPYGTVVQYRVQVGPIERDGEVVALSFISTAITEQGPEVEDRYRFLAEAGMEGLIIHDRNAVIDANQAVCEMFGYDIADLSGRPIADLFAAPSRLLLLEPSFYETGALHDAVGLRNDGTSFPIEVCGKSLPHPSGLATVIAVRAKPHPAAPVPAASSPAKRTRAASTAAAANKLGPVDLSTRELDVLELLAQGMTNRAVSERLRVSARTVDHHVSHILGKLGVSNRTAAAMAARRKGLLRQDK